jgi:DNA-binding protein Alba
MAEKEEKKDDNVIFIGKKGVMSYVLAVVTQFNNGAKEVIIKARGKAISRAVDTEEITKNRFIPELKMKEVRISTEEVDNEDGTKAKVSAIEIALTK